MNLNVYTWFVKYSIIDAFQSQLMVLHASCSIDTKQLFNISYGQLMNCSNQLLVHRQIPRPSGSRSLFFKQY